METEDEVIYPRAVTIFASVCAIIFCVVGVAGNLITILALTRCPKLRTHPTTYFVLSLCISDFIFCLINMPITATRYIQEEWTLGEDLCKLFPVLFYGNVTLSVLNMVAITINRYVLISCNQYYSRLYSKISIYAQLAFIWTISFVILLPPLLGVWGDLGLNKTTFSCTILKNENGSPKDAIFIVGFVLPCVVIITSYSCIFWKVRASRKNLEAHRKPSDKRSMRKERDDRRLTNLMVIIFICFLSCFLPLMIVNVSVDEMNFPTLHVLASILAWFSSVINPFIYAGSNRQYREAYAKLLHLVKNTVSFSESRHLSDVTNPTHKTPNSSNQNYAPVPVKTTANI
ncbi:PREDICTED: protein trapped in endoderm-1 [Nicrophorus vespilloides]|uniref:Protein trapped in endoderm-1 n=1 Tax=Nicrophorus vespilloides TaxID=110193 RepID=A0ABM1NF67_NICVS|nr:PREDICTED: protein trapped in endoderm-1 [Nicrophorus vespilloides]